MPTINKLLEAEQWDAVRSIFKAAPVNLACALRVERPRSSAAPLSPPRPPVGWQHGWHGWHGWLGVALCTRNQQQCRSEPNERSGGTADVMCLAAWAPTPHTRLQHPWHSVAACSTYGCRWEQTLAKKNPFKRLADLRDDVEQA